MTDEHLQVGALVEWGDTPYSYRKGVVLGRKGPRVGVGPMNTPAYDWRTGGLSRVQYLEPADVRPLGARPALDVKLVNGMSWVEPSGTLTRALAVELWGGSADQPVTCEALEESQWWVVVQMKHRDHGILDGINYNAFVNELERVAPTENFDDGPATYHYWDITVGNAAYGYTDFLCVRVGGKAWDVAVALLHRIDCGAVLNEAAYEEAMEKDYEDTWKSQASEFRQLLNKVFKSDAEEFPADAYTDEQLRHVWDYTKRTVEAESTGPAEDFDPYFGWKFNFAKVAEFLVEDEDSAYHPVLGSVLPRFEQRDGRDIMVISHHIPV